MRLAFTLILVVLSGIRCAPSSSLSEEEMSKLDPALQHLVEQDGDVTGPFRYVTSTREDDTTVFAVILQTNDPEALREAGLPIASVFGEIATARLSLEELKQAARMEDVRAVSNSEQDLVPQPPSDAPTH